MGSTRPNVLFLSWLIDDPATDEDMRTALIARRREGLAALPPRPTPGESIH